MRKLKAEGALNDTQMLFMAESKPIEELYDYIADPHCTNNLAGKAEYKEQIERMRGYMADWQSKHNDMGLADRAERKLADYYREENRLRYYLKTRHLEEWEDICDGIIFDQYDHYKKMMKAEQKLQKR